MPIHQSEPYYTATCKKCNFGTSACALRSSAEKALTNHLEANPSHKTNDSFRYVPATRYSESVKQK